jgi:predicted deacylase
VDFREYAERFQAHRAFARIDAFATVREGEGDYPLLRATTDGSRTLVITSGFHGEEPAGPLTLLESLPEIVEYSRDRDVGLRIYPCINPSGFEDRTRYNRSGEKPNNDFLRYEVAPGQWKGELYDGDRFLRWELHREGPKETRAITAELHALPEPHAALDIHQDSYLGGACTYAYVFGDHAAYAPLVEASAQRARVVRQALVDEHHRANELGLIVAHDGSVTDYYFRRGVPFAAALETTTRTRREDANAINLIWIRGFIDLAAGGGGGP